MLLSLLFAATLTTILPAGVQASSYADPPQLLPEVEHAEDVKVLWITVGLGPDLHARYGHTFLRFDLPGYPQPWIYNWGMFSFQDPWFPIKFYLGKRLYWVGNVDIRQLLIFYKRSEDRNVWQQPLRLTTSQKKDLMRRVNEVLTAEKMFFRYEHFSANCATIPRDLLDEVLGGYIKRQLNSQPSPVTFRHYVTGHMAFYPALGFLLDLTMNSLLDRPLTLWDESFYPIKLSSFLAGLPALDDEGNPRLKSLLGSREILVTATSTHESQVGSFALWFLILWAFPLTALLLLSRSSHHGKRGYRILFSFYSLCWGGFSALVGAVMLISWLFSTHYDMHHNLNLWLLCCTDVIMMLWGWRALQGRSWCPAHAGRPKEKVIFTPFSRVYLIGRSITLLLYLSIFLSGFAQQNISTALLYVLPLQAGYLLLCWLLITQKRSEKLRQPLH